MYIYISYIRNRVVQLLFEPVKSPCLVNKLQHLRLVNCSIFVGQISTLSQLMVVSPWNTHGFHCRSCWDLKKLKAQSLPQRRHWWICRRRFSSYHGAIYIMVVRDSTIILSLNWFRSILTNRDVDFIGFNPCIAVKKQMLSAGDVPVNGCIKAAFFDGDVTWERGKTHWGMVKDLMN